MFQLSSQVRVAASPADLWRVITDFPGFQAWTKAIVIDGTAAVGGTINYQIGGVMRSGVRRAIRFESTVKAAAPGRELIWTSGIPGVLGMRFGFDLQPVEQATEIRHWLQVSGLAAHLFRGQLSRLYGPILGIVTADLQKHMSKARLTALRTTPDIRRRKHK